MNNVKQYIDEQFKKEYFALAVKMLETKTALEQLIQKAADNGVPYNVEADELLENIEDFIKKTDNICLNHLTQEDN